jgi:hypothetical protein
MTWLDIQAFRRITTPNAEEMKMNESDGRRTTHASNHHPSKSGRGQARVFYLEFGGEEYSRENGRWLSVRAREFCPFCKKVRTVIVVIFLLCNDARE